MKAINSRCSCGPKWVTWSVKSFALFRGKFNSVFGLGLKISKPTKQTEQTRKASSNLRS
jgi:hypothetical protein